MWVVLGVKVKKKMGRGKIKNWSLICGAVRV